MILESSFGLHAKTRLLGSVFSAVAKQDGGRKGQKVSFRSSSLFTRFDNRLSASICHYIQLDISNTATASYDSPSKSHCHHFKVQIARRKIRRGPVRRLWRAPGRTEEWWTNLWTGKLPDHEWKTNLRMTRAVFMSVADELRYFLEPREDCPRRGDVLSVEKQLAMTLYYLKDQGSLRMTANSFGVAICTLSVVLRKVCTWNWWQGLDKVIFI